MEAVGEPYRRPAAGADARGAGESGGRAEREDGQRHGALGAEGDEHRDAGRVDAAHDRTAEDER
ncbi:hypothetical protein DKT69_19820 [Micromonospora sicca]|uniref:Uncharacterized protein n=1 Tax=Micromonospora sicca TaxID=2202420 RepID=A0A317DH56_9ACTN|nr:hypothetical protein DKT69_19820 [Micromonospora sp. 4G51]